MMARKITGLPKTSYPCKSPLDKPNKLVLGLDLDISVKDARVKNNRYTIQYNVNSVVLTPAEVSPQSYQSPEKQKRPDAEPIAGNSPVKEIVNKS